MFTLINYKRFFLFFQLFLISCSLSDAVNFSVPIFLFLFLVEFIYIIKYNKINSIIINDLSDKYLYLLLFSFPFHRSINTSILIIILFLKIIVFIKNKNYKIILERINLKNIPFLVFIFATLLLINYIYFNSVNEFDKEIYIFLLSIIFLINTTNTYSLKRVVDYYIYSILVSFLILFIYNYYHNSLLFPTNVFFSDFLDLSHVYYGLYIGFGTVLFMIYYLKKISLVPYFLINCALFLLLIYIGARMSFFALCFVTVIFIFRNITKKINKILFLFTSSLLILIFVFINPRFKTDLEYSKELFQAIEKNDKQFLTDNSWQNINMRYFIFVYSLDIIKDNPVFGIGFSSVKDVLYEKSQNDELYYMEKINPHNQFLHFIVSLGIPTFIFFIYLIFICLKNNIKNNYVISFILYSILIMFTESILVRNKGIHFYYLFLLFLPYFSNKVSDK